jgi:hypothetical protein
MELAKKLTIEVLKAGAAGSGKRTPLSRYVLAKFASADEARKQVLERAKRQGHEVLSVNFRADKDERAIDSIVVVVKG